MTVQRTISIPQPNGSLNVSNQLPLTLFGGLNVLESRDLALTTATTLKEICTRLGIAFVFKGSFDKANRSSIQSYRGPGLEEGLRILEDVKKNLAIPVMTDVHEPDQAKVVSKVVDILQLPAFLSRQTDLIAAIAATKLPVNIKKAQFLASDDMHNIISKFNHHQQEQLLLCERGNCFGYHNLIVDMVGMEEMKRSGYPLLFDVTHSLQLPGGRGTAADGRRQYLPSLARAGIAIGIAGLFIETHPEPDKALCDGACAVPLTQMEGLLTQLSQLDKCVKSMDEIVLPQPLSSTH